MSIVDGNQGGVVEGLKRNSATIQTIGTLQAGTPHAGSDFSIVTSQNVRGFSSQNVISPAPEPAKPAPVLKGLQPGQTAKSRDPRSDE